VRQRAAAKAFAGLAQDTHPGSYYVLLHLDERWRAEGFAVEARRRGVGVLPASVFLVGRGGAEAVRVCLGPARDRDTLAAALGTLAALARGGDGVTQFAAGP
jgi:DNA-binding transcriptional MocR family regulator